MSILAVLIALMLTAVIAGKFNWKLRANPFIAATIIALLQALFVAIEMLIMKLPWNK